jgi:hypothetical protein
VPTKVLTCEVLETGSKYQPSKGRMRMRWREQRRSVKALPFQLALENGVVVDIEAGNQFLLAAPLEQQLYNGNQRTREASVSTGDTVWVCGNCTAEAPSNFNLPGYRGATKPSLVMRSTQAMPVEIYTTAPASEFAGQASATSLAIGTTIFFAILLSGMVLLPYVDLALGTTTSCTTGAWTQHIAGKGASYYVGTCVTDNVTTSHTLARDPGVGASLPIRVGSNDTRLGVQPTLSVNAPGALVLYLLVGLLANFLSRRELPWYRQAHTESTEPIFDNL